MNLSASSVRQLRTPAPSLIDIKVEKAKRNLINFTRHTFPDYQVNWHHLLVASYLDKWQKREIKRLMIFMPPRNGKSELVSRRLPSYILGKEPDVSIIACSHTADLASRMNRDVQRIVDSPEYAEVFSETKLFGSNVRAVAGNTYLRNSDIFEVVNRKGVYKSAGVGGAITGLGCQYGIIDDPIKNRKEAESPTYRNAIFDWYTSTFYTRLEKDACILITMTRWHEDDLAGRLLELAKSDPDADQWVVLSLPAIAEDARHLEDKRDSGEPLWPGKYPLSELKKIKATVGSYDWAGMFQQRPSPAEGGIFKRWWWKFWQPVGVNLPPITLRGPNNDSITVEAIPLPAKFDQQAQSWDMAFKDTKSSAYVVGQVWGRFAADKFLLDQDREKRDFVSTIATVSTLTQKWPKAIAKWVEDKANGPAVISTLQGKIAGLIAVEPEGSKIARAYAVSPEVEGGNVYLPHPAVAPWVWDFIEECAGFPNSTYADQVDTMTQALLRFESDPRPLDDETKELFKGASLHG